MVSTEGLTHIHLIVRDLDRSMRFYQRVFGLEEQFRDGPKMIFLGTPGRADTVTLNEDPEAQDRAGDNGGIAHFGFRLLDKSDLDAAIADVEEAGGHLVRRGEHEPDHPFAYVTDPDGYVIEL